VLAETDVALGEALGKLYVERAFGPQAKQKALALVANLQAALRVRLSGSSGWVKPRKPRAIAKTRRHAREDRLSRRVARLHRLGHQPDLVREQRPRGPALRVPARPGQSGQVRGPQRVGHDPITNNAFYEPTLNELVFPAGVLQPPYFHPRRTMPRTTGTSAPRSATK